MSGFWLKWEKGLTRKPEILKLSARLMVPPAHAAGVLMMLMEWLDDSVPEFTEDGHADVTLGSLPYTFIDSITGISGTADALIEVGWLKVNGDLIRFVNVGRHNGKTGKNRALATERKRKERSRSCHDTNVTMSRTLCSVSVSESEGVRGGIRTSNELVQRIYEAYPRKQGRIVAIRAIEKATKSITPEVLLERTRRFAEIVATWPAGDEQFVPMPATWFNQGRYDDDPDTWKRAARTQNGRPVVTEEFKEPANLRGPSQPSLL